MTSPTTFCELWIFFHTFLSLAVSFFKSLKNNYMRLCTCFQSTSIYQPALCFLLIQLHLSSMSCAGCDIRQKKNTTIFCFFGSKHEVLLQAEKGRKVCNKCNCFIPWISLWNISVYILNKCFLPLFNAPWPIKPYLIWQQGLEVYGCLIVTSASVLVS